MITKNTEEKIIFIDKPQLEYKFLEANRFVREDHVKSLMSAIVNKEWLPPIFVTKDGFIIDGQHRYQAFCKCCENSTFKGNLRVLVIESDEDPIQLAIKLNNSAKRWLVDDYFHAYLEIRKPSYVYLKNFMLVHVRYIAGVRAALQLITGSYPSKVFKEGNLQLSLQNIKEADEKMENLKTIYSIIDDKRVFKRDIILAFYNIFYEVKNWGAFFKNIEKRFKAPLNERSKDWLNAYRACL